ncbi:general transcription factor II-I repeat domain-containing protein 2A-like [Diabrotica virgifera virgifera]|uniref:General transcription factor II-I repeat domain-containing protein 2A-like n=1 Tax=Diabrotica virgifera virgifera TaxID=50390 RepID=A0ABM5KCF2_DIAVI|nr:general transcription factor II-I repeat domain-containing protein 2A-like [Diabrotica virgifera virgifera]
MIAEAIAKRSKPLSDGEFVKECLEMFASVACPEQEALVKNISLSHQTIARRIDDMTKDIESSLKTQLKKCVFYSFALDESTDVPDTAQLTVFIRGLCAKVLELKHVMDKVVQTVNFIRARGLNHRQFQAFLSDVGSDHEDIMYFSSVRWLSRASTLKRFYSLLDEVKIFLENKGQEIDFLTDEQWLADLAFLVDITKYLSDLNLKLQGKDQLCTQLYEHIQAFTKKLILLEKQLEQKQLVHWETLSARNQEMLDLAKYVSLLQRLRNEFEERFVDFKLQIPNMKVFQNPFEIEIDGAVLNLQMELIELQSDSLLKTIIFNDIATCKELTQLDGEESDDGKRKRGEKKDDQDENPFNKSRKLFRSPAKKEYDNTELTEMMIALMNEVKEIRKDQQSFQEEIRNLKKESCELKGKVVGRI